MCCTWLTEIQDAKMTQKIAIWAPSHNFVGLYLRNWGMYRHLEKNLLSSNISSTCPHNMVNFGLLTAEIHPVMDPAMQNLSSIWQTGTFDDLKSPPNINLQQLLQKQCSIGLLVLRKETDTKPSLITKLSLLLHYLVEALDTSMTWNDRMTLTDGWNSDRSTAAAGRCCRTGTSSQWRRQATEQSIFTFAWSDSSLELEEHVHNTPFTRYSQLSNQFDNRLYRAYKHLTGCQNGLTPGTGLTTVLTTGCIV